MPTSSNTTVGLGWYAVAFFDILGQQERLRSIHLPEHRNDPKAMEDVREALRATYGAVLQMRDDFKSAFDAYARSRDEMDLSGLDEQQRIEFRSLVNEPIRFRGFSDSLVVYLPLRPNDAAKLPVRGIYGILSAAAVAFTCSLARGHPIRGGIDVGVGVIHGEDEIYGPALSRAYTLESRVADYPRVVVGEELVKYIRAHANQPQDSLLTGVGAKIASRCAELLTIDCDGHPIVDHMGQHIHDLISSKIDGAVIKCAYEEVIKSVEHFKAKRDSRLAFRYNTLLDYFDDRLPIWQDVLSKPPTNRPNGNVAGS